MSDPVWNLQNLEGVSTLADLWDWRVAHTPEGDAYRAFDAASAAWQTLSWQAADAHVASFTAALARFGLPHGARVAILLPNGLTHVFLDQGVLRAGLVPVPLHAIDNPASVSYILGDAGVSLLFVGEAAQWRAIAAAGPLPPTLKAVIALQDAPLASAQETPPLLALDAWLAAAEHEAGEGRAAMPARPAAGDLAAIVYTSGTTGRPKGVMLSHRNVLANIGAVLQLVAARPNDVFLSFLPLSHTFERTCGYYLPVAAGSCVAFARSVADVADDLVSQRPTVLISVPRIYERFHQRLQESLERGSAFTRRLFALASAVGWRRFARRHRMPAHESAGAPPWLDALLWPLLQRLVARKLTDRFGGRLRVAVSGGAPLAPQIARTFLGLGVPLLQGYGMTETAPVVAANLVEDNWPATVGRPLPGVDVRIGADGELQVRGPNVMRGYWNLPDASARAWTQDGWLHTGDQAVIEDGRIRIVGRLKEIIVTSTGEKIAPADLELAIAADPLFEQVMAVGEQRPFIGVMVVLNGVAWRALATELGANPGAPDSLADPRVKEALLARVRAQCGHFPHYAVPRAVIPTMAPWTVEDGSMTPTLKLKRPVLLHRFENEINAMYAAGRPEKAAAAAAT